jgi:hypothetical protein
MKSIITTCSVAILLIFNTAWADGDFSGHWEAHDGKVSSNVGLKGDCSLIQIDLEQTADSLIIKKYHSVCTISGTTWGPIREDIKDGKVYENGELAGTFDGTTLKTTMPDGSVVYAVNLRLEKDPTTGAPVLRSYYGVQNIIGAIAEEAVLKH